MAKAKADMQGGDGLVVGVMVLPGQHVLVAEAAEGVDLNKVFDQVRKDYAKCGNMGSFALPVGVRVQVI